jgi:hypothetical protein
MTDSKITRDDLDDLLKAVRELRDSEVADVVRDLRAEVERLRAEKAAPVPVPVPCVHVCHCVLHHCNWGHCGCWTFHSYGYVPTYPLTGGVWYGTVTMGTGMASTAATPLGGNYTVTNTAGINTISISGSN